MDLSLQSGMSQRHISFLETGRSNPSRFAIAQLAEALEMPAAEIDAMLLSAGFAARSAQKAWDDNIRHAVDVSIDHILQSHAPYPALSVDRVWNVVKANDPAKQFLARAGARGDPNLFRELLTPGPIRDCIINWEEVARALLRLLELELARRPNDTEAHELLTDLLKLKDVKALRDTPAPSATAPVLTLKFQIGEDVLDLFSLIATIGMSADASLDDLRIETLLPANDATRAWFENTVL